MAIREITESVGIVAISAFIILSHLQGLVHGNLENLKSPGNIKIGAVEQLCVVTENSSCAEIDINGLLKVEAILYAVKNANKRARDNGMNVTLGYDIWDSSKRGAYKSMWNLIDASEKTHSPIVVVGNLPQNGDRSDSSLLLLLSRRITHISCDSSSIKPSSEMAELSERVFHAQPTDKMNIKAMLSVIALNKWSYIGVVLDHSAESLLSQMKKEAAIQNICIGNTYRLSSGADEQQVSNLVKKLNIQKSFSVIVALTSSHLTRRILNESSNQKVHGLTWITGQRSWPTTKSIPLPNSAAQGMFNIISRRSTLGFVDYLRSLSSGTKRIENMWLRQTALKDGPASMAGPGSVNGSIPPGCDDKADPLCGMDEDKLKTVIDKMIDVVGNAGCTIDAVMTVARALEAQQLCIDSSDCNEDTMTINNYVQQVDFTNSLTGTRISFTSSHTLNYTRFHVYNYQQNYSRITAENKNLKAVEVGSYTSSPKTRPSLKISDNRIEWHGGSAHAPQSRCHEVCRPSFYRHLKENRRGSECCWECKKCRSGEYSDREDVLKCSKCPITHRPSVDQLKCIPYNEDYVHWDHGGSLLILFLMVVGLCFGIYIAFVLFRSSETRMVRKAKSAVLCLLPFVILLFLLPIPLLGKPTEASCEGYRVFFLVALGIPLSVLIAKSQFFDNRCQDKSENGDACCTPRLSIACFIVLLHILMAVILGLTIPAKVNRLPTDDPYTVFLECSYHSTWEFEVVVFFHMFLAVLVSIFSINEIISEENNNEVKWISCAMFNWYAITFFYIMFTFGVHYHAKVIMLGLMCILHAFNLLGLLYVPKWFIAVFRPEKNRSDVSPWTDYIKTQEKVSERLSAPEGSPFPTRKGRADGSDGSAEAKGLMTDADI